MKYEIDESKEKQERILEAVNYLLLKNRDFEYLDGDILFDRKEKKYYDIKTGELLNRKEK